MRQVFGPDAYAFRVRFQCPGVGPSVCDDIQSLETRIWTHCFNAPVWGLRFATEYNTVETLAIDDVSMPRCGAFGVRHGPLGDRKAALVLFQCPGVGPSVCDRSS